MKKMTYEKPTFEKIGSFEAITKSTNTGTTVDSNFANTQPSVLGSLS